MIPNVRPDKEYSYDPSQYTDASKDQLDHLAHNNIARESSFNTRVDQARAQEAARRAEQQAAAQQAAQAAADKKTVEDANVTVQKTIQDVVPAVQQATVHLQAVSTPKSELNSDKPWYQRAYDSTVSTVSSGIEYTAKAASTAYNGTVDYVSRNVVEPTVETYKQLEGQLATTLRVKDDDNVVVASLKRNAAASVATVRGAVMFGAEKQ